MKFLAKILFILLANVGIAHAQNTLFPANPGDMIVRGTHAWVAVPGGASGCVLTSNGPGAPPTWQCALALNFQLPPMAPNTVWGNVTAAQAVGRQITATQFLDTIDYDIQRTPLNGSMLTKVGGIWRAIPTVAPTGWVWTNQGTGQSPQWAPLGGNIPPGAAGTCLVSNGVGVTPSYQTCPVAGTYVTSLGGVSGVITLSTGLSMVGAQLTSAVYQAPGSVTLNVDHASGVDAPSCGFMPSGPSACQHIYYAAGLFQTVVKVGVGGTATIQSDCNFTETPPGALLGPIATGNSVLFIRGDPTDIGTIEGCKWRTAGLHVDDFMAVSISGFHAETLAPNQNWMSAEKFGLFVYSNMLFGSAEGGAHIRISEGGRAVSDGGIYAIGLRVGGCAPACFDNHVVNSDGGWTPASMNVPQVLDCSAWYAGVGPGQTIVNAGIVFTGAGGAGGGCQPFNLTRGAKFDPGAVVFPGAILGTVSSGACLNGVCVNVGRPNLYDNLPVCNSVVTGTQYTVQDSTTGAWGDVVAIGGGGIKRSVQCMDDGTWKIYGPG